MTAQWENDAAAEIRAIERLPTPVGEPQARIRDLAAKLEDWARRMRSRVVA